ncbi:hypothetical protein, partial [Eisenbergiella tayi]|uniref:hypothetical protein n=1 Tax=Eisenbergiella tayi TaxID=1432052 RepID=UPI001C253909
ASASTHYVPAQGTQPDREGRTREPDHSREAYRTTPGTQGFRGLFSSGDYFIPQAAWFSGASIQR